MAYIVNFLIALIYLVPSAIFFWLGKDVVIALVKKLADLIAPIINSQRNKEKLPEESVPADETTAGGIATDEDVVPDEDAVPVEDATTVEDAVPFVDATTVEDAVPIGDATTEESIAEAQETEVFIPDRGVVAERFSAQMTIEEAVSAGTASDKPASEPPAPVEPGNEEQAAEELSPETEGPSPDVEEPIPEAEGPSPDVEETTQAASMQDGYVPEETEKEEPSPEEPAPEDFAFLETAMDEPTLDEAEVESFESGETPATEPINILSNLKSGFAGVTQKVKQLNRAAPFKNLIDKTRQKNDEMFEKPTDGVRRKSGVFDKVVGQLKPRADASDDEFIEVSDISDDSGTAEDIDTIEDKVKRQFDDLDMITTSAIAIMLSETKSKTTSPYIKNLKKPDIRVILLKFCKETFFATDIEQINSLFRKSYYKRKIHRYLHRLTVFIKRGIGDSLPKRVAFQKARITKNRFINKICETINTFESVKYISALSGNEEVSDSKRNYKLDHLSENYKDALIYLVDILLTCTCISKMLFVERMIKKMDVNSEFNKIITNMAHSIDNHNLIISKSRPIYKQYYQAELGYINGDELLYGMAITIMVNRVKKVEVSNTDILQLSDGPPSAREFSTGMLKWLDALSIDDDVEDIGTLILQKITLSIKDNYSLLTSALQELTNWEDYYYKRVAYYKKARDRERYLIGDFEAEKRELRK